MSSRRGALAFIFVLTLFGLAVLFAVWTLRARAPSTPEAFVLSYDVPSQLEDEAPPPRPFPWGGLVRPRPTLNQVTRALRHAARDSRVRGLVLHIDGVDWGWAKIAEVRDALLDFRASGKPLTACLRSGGEAEYLLASPARRICMPPTETLWLDGLTASAMFFGGTFDKLDVTPNFARVGRYKSAVESFTRRGFSEPARQMLDALVSDQYLLLVDSLAAARGMLPAEVERLVGEGPYGAPQAVAAGLVDTLLYPPEVDSLAARRGKRTLAIVPFKRYVRRVPRGRGEVRMALVHVTGTIAPGKSREGFGEGRVAGAETIVDALDEARNRDDIVAVILRIDSPGGSSTASDEIWREVSRCNAEKPVVASMSDLAASGGYYVAVGAGEIVAEPSTLTGSIGVFGGKFNVLGLYHKLGLNVESVSRGAHAEMLSPYRDFTPEEAAIYQRSMDDFYKVFVSRVADGRGMTEAAVDSVGQGYVWTGLEARGRGLVDRFGGIREAVEVASERAHLAPGTTVRLETLPEEKLTFLERMLLDLWTEDDDDPSASALPTAALPRVVRAWLTAARFPAGSVLALLPWDIRIR